MRNKARHWSQTANSVAACMIVGNWDGVKHAMMSPMSDAGGAGPSVVDVA